MIFDYFYLWDEEKIGLAGGISFVLLGLFAYLLYRFNSSMIFIIIMLLIVIFTALTAWFFELPRIKNAKPGVSTLIGGITWGLSFVLWGYSIYLIPPKSWEFLGEVAALSLGLLISSFFAFGFLFIAAIEPAEKEIHKIPRKIKEPKKKGIKEFKEDEDFIDRL